MKAFNDLMMIYAATYFSSVLGSLFLFIILESIASVKFYNERLLRIYLSDKLLKMSEG